MTTALLSLLLLLFTACSNSGPTYRIGLDPSWYPIDLPEKEPNLLAFSTDLLQEIAKCEQIQLVLVRMSWDNLLWGLDSKRYEGALSTLLPYNFNMKKYRFSDPYFMTGPVLVAPTELSIDLLSTLKGREVGYMQGSGDDALLKGKTGAIFRPYSSVPEALNAVVRQELDAALINYVLAEGYCQDLFQGRLQVATPPLDEAGVRLISLKEQPPELIEVFNRGLSTLIEEGTYAELAIKWNLPPLPREAVAQNR